MSIPAVKEFDGQWNEGNLTLRYPVVLVHAGFEVRIHKRWTEQNRNRFDLYRR
jgi:hypothetical protein